MDPDARDPTWRYPWPAGQRMAADLTTLRDWSGGRVLELGCGQGLVGRAALAAGAAQVTFTDISDEPLEHLRSLLADEPRARFLHHAWGDPVPAGPYDVVVGGDILYRPAFFPQLVRSIAAALDVGGTALLGDPRTELEQDLEERLRQAGFSTSTQRRPGPYTLLTAQRPG
jgi:predicted nicotinamide N-methyase